MVLHQVGLSTTTPTQILGRSIPMACTCTSPLKTVPHQLMRKSCLPRVIIRQSKINGDLESSSDEECDDIKLVVMVRKTKQMLG
jgi:hypothetical protein